MSKLTNWMAPVCSVHDSYFRYFTKTHKYSPQESLRGEEDIFPTKRAHDVGKNRNNDHAVYNML